MSICNTSVLFRKQKSKNLRVKNKLRPECFWLSSCSENFHSLYTKFEPNTSPAVFCKPTSVYSVGTLRSQYSRYLHIFFAHYIITNRKFNEKVTVLLIQHNPTHHMCWKMRPNPTKPMDGPNPCPSLGLCRISRFVRQVAPPVRVKYKFRTVGAGCTGWQFTRL